MAKNCDGITGLKRGLLITCRYAWDACTFWAPLFDCMFSDMSAISLQLLVLDLPVGDCWECLLHFVIGPRTVSSLSDAMIIESPSSFSLVLSSSDSVGFISVR